MDAGVYERERECGREKEKGQGVKQSEGLLTSVSTLERDTERGARWGGGGNAPYVRMRAPAVISGDF